MTLNDNGGYDFEIPSENKEDDGKPIDWYRVVINIIVIGFIIMIFSNIF